MSTNIDKLIQLIESDAYKNMTDAQKELLRTEILGRAAEVSANPNARTQTGQSGQSDGKFPVPKISFLNRHAAGANPDDNQAVNGDAAVGDIDNHPAVVELRTQVDELKKLVFDLTNEVRTNDQLIYDGVVNLVSQIENDMAPIIAQIEQVTPALRAYQENMSAVQYQQAKQPQLVPPLNIGVPNQPPAGNGQVRTFNQNGDPSGTNETQEPNSSLTQKGHWRN